MAQIWKLPTEGGAPQPVTKRGGISPQESPDGRLVYYSKRPGGSEMPIWKVPVEGGDEILALDKSSHWERWTLWRDNLIYINPEGRTGPTIEMFDLRSRALRELVALGKENPPDSGLSVSPDGQWILYSRDDLGGCDLLLIEGFH